MRSLILASSSEPRKKLLSRLKIPFQTFSPDIDETPLKNETAENLVVRLAKEKAAVVAGQYPDAIIIGADQVGVFDSKILCKPTTRDDAIKQLLMMSGQTVPFLIGLCVIDVKNNNTQVVLEKFSVVFRSLSLDMINSYLDRESVLNCAGSFKIEGLGIALVEKLVGDDYTALIGLPLIRLIEMLNKIGFDILKI